MCQTLNELLGIDNYRAVSPSVTCRKNGYLAQSQEVQTPERVYAVSSKKTKPNDL